jgi:hypothetical protein
VPHRRKFGRGQYQRQLEAVIRDAIPTDDEVEILEEDVVVLRGLIRQFDELVSNVRARNAKPVDQQLIEHKRLFGNGRY